MDNNSIFSVSVSQLLHHYKIREGIGNSLFATAQIVEYIHMLSFPCRVDALIFCVCIKGNLNITVNLKEWDITKNTYAISFPENVIGINSVSDDFEGYIILFPIDYLRRISIDLKEILPYYVYVRNYPCIKATGDKVKRITRFYQLIHASLEDMHSGRKDEIIKGLASSMIFKICEDLDDLGLNNRKLRTKSKEYYFVKFMEFLLQEFRGHHNVGYYSDKLAITPKYLSALMREVSGLSAAQWIDEYIVTESKTLLRFSDMSIKQIADYLHFPNQSFFSKYFRQHTGMTPGNYRMNSD